MADPAPLQPIDGVARTGDYLSFHAALRPQATALIADGRALSFAELRDRARFAASALAQAGIGPGGFVCVEWTGLLDHIPLVLALESLGAASASFLPDAAAQDHAEMLAHADLVLSDRPLAGAARRTMGIATLGAGLKAAGDPPKPPIDPASVYRMVTSSGTTGAPKVIAITLGQTERRLDVIQWMVGFSAASRFVHCMPYTFQGAQFQASACLRAGGTGIHVGLSELWDGLAEKKATHTAVLPFHFTMLQADETLLALPERLTITSYGGAIPEPVRARFRQARPDIRLFETYATNELGTIAVRLTDGSYQCCPGSEVQIVDGDHRPLPPGAEGIVRIRKTGMVPGYIYNARASAEKFRDGWFYPGDVGVKPDAALFRILGREDSLINVGGVKFSAEDHERVLTALPEIADACLLSRPNEKGENEIWVAVVSAAEMPFDTLADLVSTALPDLIGTINILTVNQIPRTTSGKVQRQAVLDALNRREG